MAAFNRHTRDPKFHNGDGSLTRYSFACGYIEKKKVLDGTRIDFSFGEEQVEVTLWMEHQCYHAQRSDWARLKNINGDGTPGWFSSGSLTEARAAARKLRHGFLQIGEKTGVVHSSSGDFAIDMSNGVVLKYAKDYEGPRILVFDLKEYFSHYTKETRDDTVEFDVLDLGVWTLNGRYENAEPDFRAAVAKNCGG